jgi:hypothetical protein
MQSLNRIVDKRCECSENEFVIIKMTMIMTYDMISWQFCHGSVLDTEADLLSDHAVLM